MRGAKALLFLCVAFLSSCNNKSTESLNRGELKKGSFIVLTHQAGIKEKYEYENDEYIRDPSRYGTQARIDKTNPDKQTELYLCIRSKYFCRVLGFVENTNENGITLQKIYPFVNDAKLSYYSKEKEYVFFPWSSILNIELGGVKKPQNIEIRSALE